MYRTTTFVSRCENPQNNEKKITDQFELRAQNYVNVLFNAFDNYFMNT